MLTSLLFRNHRSISILPYLSILIIVSSASAQFSWVQTKGPSGGSLYSVVVKPGMNIFAASYSSTSAKRGIFRSTDYGETWTNTYPAISFWSLSKTSTGTLIAGIDGGGFTVSTNDGAAWAAKGPNNKTFRYMYVTAGDTILACGNSGALYHSVNQGSTWSSIGTGLPAADILAVTDHPSGDLYAGIWNAGVYRSTNRGTSWAKSDTGITDKRIRSMVANAQGTLFAASDGGGVFRSTNKGETWTAVNSGLTWAYTYSIRVTSNGTLFVGTYGGMFRSTNNGDSWTEINTGLGVKFIRSLVFDTDGTLLVGTDDGLVFRSATSTAVSEHSGAAAVQFSLGQNYPNPFNPSTQIQFHLSQNSNVTLSVFDALGRLVSTLVNGEVSAGVHTVAFEGRGLASGMYLYRLSAGESVVMKRMMLVK